MGKKLRGRPLLYEKRLPRTPSRREKRTGVCEGGGFSERSPSLALPPEERLAFGLCASAGMVPPESWARFLCKVVEVTAADRAAATVRGASADVGRGYPQSAFG